MFTSIASRNPSDVMGNIPDTMPTVEPWRTYSPPNSRSNSPSPTTGLSGDIRRISFRGNPEKFVQEPVRIFLDRLHPRKKWVPKVSLVPIISGDRTPQPSSPRDPPAASQVNRPSRTRQREKLPQIVNRPTSARLNSSADSLVGYVQLLWQKSKEWCQLLVLLHFRGKPMATEAKQHPQALDSKVKECFVYLLDVLLFRKREKLSWCLLQIEIEVTAAILLSLGRPGP